MTKVSQLTHLFVSSCLLIHDPPIKAIVTVDNKEILDNVCILRASQKLLHLQYAHFPLSFCVDRTSKRFWSHLCLPEPPSL